MLKLNVKKTFSLTLLDNMLNMRTEAMEDGEKINENKYDENFKYDDEIEDDRISENHRIFLMILFDMLIANEEFDLMQYNEELVKKTW